MFMYSTRTVLRLTNTNSKLEKTSEQLQDMSILFESYRGILAADLVHFDIRYFRCTPRSRKSEVERDKDRWIYWETCHKSWSDRAALPEIYLTRGTTIADTAKRAITNQQLNQASDFVNGVLTKVEIVETSERSPLRGKRLTPDNVSMYSVHDYFVFPITLPHLCSFVDLVSTAEEQPPEWFVSHAWSTPFSQTVWMLNHHVKSRDLPPTTAYWICTFANNQHDLGQPL